MSVGFRNVEVPDDAPVADWPYEALVAAVERGSIRDWARITAQIAADPWGDVARAIEDYLGYCRPWGVAPLLERAITRARHDADAAERSAVAAEVRALVERSGLGAQAFARRIGTSRSRLSTYMTGRVMPSASLLVRMRRVADGTSRPEPLT